MRRLLYFLMGFALTLQAYGQERCGTVKYQEMLNPQQSLEEVRFENWMRTQTIEPKLKGFDTEGTTAAAYVIPIVFHIIHNGEPIGTGTNISDEQIISQINVLNKDFQRLNADA
ncbi:MAG: hypothetical protein RIA63_07795, partial [Cyclobacteriaceae bacterium]